MEAIIFDLDGVLVHTDELHYQAWKGLADTLGIEFDRCVNERLRGVSRMASLEILLERSDKAYSPEEKQAMAAGKNERYRQLLMGLTPMDVTQEVRDTLDTLRGMGLKLAVGSSSKNAPLILERVGLTGLFDAVSDGNSISRSKPDPEVFEKAAALMGVPCSACLVVEDAAAGIQAGKACGMTTAAVGSAAGTGESDYDLQRFSELKEIACSALRRQIRTQKKEGGRELSKKACKNTGNIAECNYYRRD